MVKVNGRARLGAKASAIAIAMTALLGGLSSHPADAADALSSTWQPAHAARARLIVAGGPLPGKPLQAGIEIQLSDGWKTYWRVPGDAGGVPPAFDWAGSDNVAAEVLFPAPARYTDRAGDTVGYKGNVVLPVRLAVTDPTKPVALRLKLDYGICREICVPAEASFSVDVPAGQSMAQPEALSAALARVPSAPTAATPALVSQRVDLAGQKPQITFEATFPGSAARADAFIEASGGVALPLPRKAGEAQGDRQSFVVDLTPEDAKDLAGKTLTVTLVGENSQSEVRLAAP